MNHITYYTCMYKERKLWMHYMSLSCVINLRYNELRAILLYSFSLMRIELLLNEVIYPTMYTIIHVNLSTMPS